MKRLEGKTAIVTGGGSGIGRSVALMLAARARGWRSWAGARSRERVVAEIERDKGTAVARTCDEPIHEARELGAWAVKTFGGVDILINNAGESSHARSIRWTPQEQWESVINVNLTGVYALTQSVLQSMIDRGAGTVVTVASLAACGPGGLGRGRGRLVEADVVRGRRVARWPALADADLRTAGRPSRVDDALVVDQGCCVSSPARPTSFRPRASRSGRLHEADTGRTRQPDRASTGAADPPEGTAAMAAGEAATAGAATRYSRAHPPRKGPAMREAVVVASSRTPLAKSHPRLVQHDAAGRPRRPLHHATCSARCRSSIPRKSRT